MMGTVVILDTDISYRGTRNLDFIPSSMLHRLKELGCCSIWSPELTDIYELNRDIIETTKKSSSLITISSFLHP